MQLKDFIKRLILFIILMLIFSYISLWIGLSLKGYVADDILNMLNRDFLEIGIKSVFIAIVCYSIFYPLQTLFTKKEWDPDKLYVKVQVITFIFLIFLEYIFLRFKFR